MKRFECPYCGYVHESLTAPKKCSRCQKVIREGFFDTMAGQRLVAESQKFLPKLVDQLSRLIR